MPAPAAPRRRTGPRCCCACISAGPSSTATRSSGWRRAPGEEAGIKSATIADQGPERLWLAEDRERRASPGAHLALRFQRAPPHQLRLGLGLSGDRRQDRSRDPGQGSDASTPTAPPAPAASTSTRPTRAIRITHIADRHRRAVPGRPLAAPQPRDGDGHAEGADLRGGAAEARGGGRGAGGDQDAISAGATRSAPMCCSPTRW